MSMKYIPKNVRFGVEVCRRVWIVLITICNVEYFSSTAMCGFQEEVDYLLHLQTNRFMKPEN